MSIPVIFLIRWLTDHVFWIREFAESTVLTIAHRIRTVIDYDRIMVLDEGRIVEFARPARLLEKEEGVFYALCRATGREEFSMLKKLAA